MQLPYFYEPVIPQSKGSILLSEETSRHCVQVLRMKTGEQLQLTDGKGYLYTASIGKADKKHCEAIISESTFTQAPAKKVSIAISLLKNASRFEWFLEKAVEMGVLEIVPLVCERTEKQYFKQERMQGIVVSAMLQSRQCWLPVLHTPTAFAKAVAAVGFTGKFVAYCIEDADKKQLNSLPIPEVCQILIGPEGDFTQAEIALALQYSYQPVSLGSTRLRTETAGVVASALLMYTV